MYGRAIRRLMTEHDMTYAELADFTGVSKRCLHDLAKGKTKEPLHITLKKIASAFGLTVEEFEELGRMEILPKKRQKEPNHV